MKIEAMTSRCVLAFSCLSFLVAPSLAPSSAEAWGRRVHIAVHTNAVRGLPKQLRSFFERHELEMPTLAPGNRSMSESDEQRFAIDRFGRFPFVDVPHKETAFKQRFGADAETAGRLPWLAQEAFERLVNAMRSNDKEAILEAADSLATLVTDIHNPLALTENWDGQLSRQNGVWMRFSIRLPDAMVDEIKLKGDVAYLIDDPDEYVFAMMQHSYIWLDNVLYEEEIAARNRPDYSQFYFETLEGRIKDILQLSLNAAVKNVSSYWYTAWAHAGRPNLETRD
jgi:hypothetical protein